MNGRVYDYRMGRFLSVDPIISNPANSQAINPYSYIGNNPLSGVDPTGYDTVALNCSDGHCVGIQGPPPAPVSAPVSPGASPMPAASSGAKSIAPQVAPTSPTDAETPKQTAQPNKPDPAQTRSPSPASRPDNPTELRSPNFFGHVDFPLIGIPVPPSMLRPYMRTREPCQGGCLSGAASAEAQQRRVEQAVAQSVSQGEYWTRLFAHGLSSAIGGIGQLGSAIGLFRSAAEGLVPRGFASAEQFAQARGELQAALEASGITDGVIGVRGSSVTGASFRTGAPFGPASDIDFYVESAQLTSGLRTSQSIPGFVHPDRVMSAYPEIGAWAGQWSEALGRPISVGGFVPGTVP